MINDYHLLPSYPLASKDFGETFHFQQEAGSLQHELEHDGEDDEDDDGAADDDDDGQHILGKLSILSRNQPSKVIQEKAFQKFIVPLVYICTVHTQLFCSVMTLT